MCSRSIASGEKAIESEIKTLGEGGYIVSDVSNIIVKELDLNSLPSVKRFADDFIATEGGYCDFLVLNAGIMALPKLERTEAGFEKQIGVNHFGHAYLTSLLLPSLISRNTPVRVVVLASSAHKIGGVDCNDLHYTNGSRKYSGWGAYGQSKTANILFAKGLAHQMKEQGHGQITSLSLHPGVIQVWWDCLFC